MTPTPRDIEIEKAAHGWSFLLATWRLCDNSACRRAHACRGAGTACLKAKFPLLPKGVREWFIGFEAQRRKGFPFEEMLENLDRAGFGQALRDWQGGAEP
jgi:hypothetical protein